jgi:polar amino acid transport system substrate-binding protein
LTLIVIKYKLNDKKSVFKEKTMKKNITIFCILVIVAVLIFGCARDTGGLTIREGVLLVGMDIGYPPMEYFGPDGITPMGFDVEMGKEIARRLELEIEFVNTDWGGIFAAVDTNRYDAIISAVTITPARLEVHNFSKPYIANTLAMVLLKDSPITARSPEEVTGLNVAFQADTTSDYYMQALVERTGLRFTPRGYDQVMRCFEELRLNRVDVIITDLLVAYDYIAPEDSPFVIVWTSPEPEVFGICMKKGNDALTDAINRVLEEMFEDGTMQRISYEIFGMDLVTQAREQW